MEKSTHVAFVLKPSRLSGFYGLLQKGILVHAHVGRSIGAILREDFGLLPEVIQEKISTLFLDGKPVDDIESATLKRGAVLALSGAMPGLVGATLRRGGVYRSLRATITHQEERPNCQCEPGVFCLKLFNVLIQELGPPFLARGIFMTAAELAVFLSQQPDGFWQDCRAMALDGAPLDPASVRRSGLPDRDGSFFLTVTAA